MTTLLVASAGGHLRSLYSLRPRIVGLDSDVIWVTWDSAQTRSLLRDERVVMVRETAPRDVVSILRNTDKAVSLLRRHRIEAVITTGSQVVIPFMTLARARGASCHFIESAARSEGPSLTGRLIRRLPGVHFYMQYPGLDAPYIGSVFDGFAVATVPEPPPAIRKAVVVLGTMPNHSFGRLLERLVALLGPDSETLWQVGSTDASRYAIDARVSVPAHELVAAMREADVVIAHAGEGSALDALEAGKHPILVPRRLAYGEHIDDHQCQVAAALAARGLVTVREADQLVADDLLSAAARTVQQVPPPPIHLNWD